MQEPSVLQQVADRVNAKTTETVNKNQQKTEAECQKVRFLLKNFVTVYSLIRPILPNLQLDESKFHPFSYIRQVSVNQLEILRVDRATQEEKSVVLSLID